MSINKFVRRYNFQRFGNCYTKYVQLAIVSNQDTHQKMMSSSTEINLQTNSDCSTNKAETQHEINLHKFYSVLFYFYDLRVMMLKTLNKTAINGR